MLPDMPENLIKDHYENLHNDFAYLTGVTKDEGAKMLCEWAFIIIINIITMNIGF